MLITFDPEKRARTLAERGLDFRDASIVFAGTKIEWIDEDAITASSGGSRRVIFVSASWFWSGRGGVPPAELFQ